MRPRERGRLRFPRKDFESCPLAFIGRDRLKDLLYLDRGTYKGNEMAVNSLFTIVSWSGRGRTTCH